MCYDGEAVSLIAAHDVVAITSDFRSDCFGMTTWHFARKAFVVEFISQTQWLCRSGVFVCVGLWCKVTDFGDASAASRMPTLNQKDTKV